MLVLNSFVLIISLLSEFPAFCFQLDPPDVTYRRQSIQLRNQSATQRCLKNTELDQVEVEGQINMLCRKSDSFFTPSFYKTGKIKYDLRREADRIEIYSSLRLRFDRSQVSSLRATAILRNARACTEKISNFWKQFDTHFKLEIDSNFEPTLAKNPYHEAELIDGMGRSSTRRFYYLGQGFFTSNNGSSVPTDYTRCKIHCSGSNQDCDTICEPQAIQEFCTTLAHESGHFLGLEDQAPDPKCPDIEYIAPRQHPISLMRDPHVGWDLFTINPRDFRRVIRPLCDPHANTDLTNF